MLYIKQFLSVDYISTKVYNSIRFRGKQKNFSIMLNTSLLQLGLNQKEIDVYLAVLQQGKATLSVIGKMTGINRTTVYSVIKNLVDKGLITLDDTGKIEYLIANDPQEIVALIDREKAVLRKKEDFAKNALKELLLIQTGKQFSVPKIRLIEENHLEQFLYKRMPHWIENNRKYDQIWWGFQDHTLLDFYGDWIEWTWKTFPGLQVKLLSNQTESEIKMEKRILSRREIKFWDKTKDFSGTVWVTGDYFITVITRTKPHYLIEINDSVLAHNQRELFKGLWEIVV